ncbi:MAG: ABC transporter permease [Bacteroidales bacterium]|jgi:ABC-2 type transport system permease protein|nr:ABC transporter permease [Bacteroidales bacterium]
MKEFRRQYLQNAVRQMTTIFWNEVIRIFTDSGVMLILFIAGLGYPLLYSFVYYQESVSEIPVAIIDNDASAYSRKFSRELDATKEVQLRRCINMNEAEYLMGRRKVHAIIVLPKDFEKNRPGRTGAGNRLRICEYDQLLCLQKCGFCNKLHNAAGE